MMRGMMMMRTTIIPPLPPGVGGERAREEDRE